MQEQGKRAGGDQNQGWGRDRRLVTTQHRAVSRSPHGRDIQGADCGSVQGPMDHVLPTLY